MDQDIKTVIQYPVGATEFDIPFDYLSRKFVRVSLVSDDNRRLLNNITEYRYVSKTRVKLLVATTGFDRVEIRRFTSASERIVDFSDGSVLRAADLNVAQLQSAHIAEEARDAALLSIGTDDLGNLDAKQRRIVNLSNGVDPTDAVNLSQVSQMVSSNIAYTVRTSQPILPLQGAPNSLAGKLISFDDIGNPVAVAASAGSPTALALQLASSLGAGMVGTSQGGTVDDIVSGYDTIVALRTFDPKSSKQRVYLKGTLIAGDTGAGFWVYDPEDQTGNDNGWFIIKTLSGKVLKREGINEFIYIKWAGQVDDIGPKVQDAVTFVFDRAMSQRNLFGQPIIVLPDGIVNWNTQVTTNPHIAMISLGNVIISTNKSRSVLPCLLKVTNANDTVDLYAANRGPRFPNLLSSVAGKIRFAWNGDATVGLINRPSAILFDGQLAAGTPMNMGIADSQCNDLYTLMDIRAYNFWGVRIVDSILSGHIGINIPSGSTLNSGERISVMNSWISGEFCAILYGAAGVTLTFDCCSLDFTGYNRNDAYPGDVIRKTVNGWGTISFTNGTHIENFKGYLVNNIGGGQNNYFLFDDCVILPNAELIAQSPSRKLFKGSGQVRASRTFVSWTTAAYDQLDGLVEAGSTMAAVGVNMRTLDAVDMYWGGSAILSRTKDFSTETVVGTKFSPSVLPTSFEFPSGIPSASTVMVKDVAKELVDSNLTDPTVRVLSIDNTANSTVQSVVIRGKDFVPVVAGEYYATKVVSTINTDASTRVYLQVEFFDVNKVSLGVSASWYRSFSFYLTPIKGVPDYPVRPNKRIGHIHNGLMAPPGASFAKLYYGVYDIKPGREILISEHFLYKSPRG